MTQTDESPGGLSNENNSDSRLPEMPNMSDRPAAKPHLRKVGNAPKPILSRIDAFINRRLGRKPAYIVTSTGIERHWFNFDDKSTLPFDTETYNDTQLFLGNWANPWYVEIEAMEENYDDFTEADITEIDDIFGTEYIYPSQRYKLFMNQDVLRQMFQKSGLADERIMRILYAVLAITGIVLAVLIFGGA